MLGRCVRACLIMLSVCTPPALAQEQVFAPMVGGRQVCAVRVTPFMGVATVGGLGFLVVDAENVDDRPHVIELGYSSLPWSNCGVAASRTITLGPHERGKFTLPLPGTGGGNHALRLNVDGVRHDGDLPIAASAGLVGLSISERPDAQPWSIVVMQSLPARSGAAPEVRSIAPGDAPADWRLFTAFDAVIVDGREPVSDTVQEALRRYAFAGGTVVVGAAARLRAGALRDLCMLFPDGGVLPHGLGRCVAVPIGGDTTFMREHFAGLPAMGGAGWPAPQALLDVQPVPGLGEAPVLVFLFVTLMFTFVVGPVNFILLRKWRRPLLVLLTVPACGLGTTIAMFGYGFLNDGLGVRGVVRSWTLLDQERHEAVSLATRTLFAGLSPSRLPVADDGFVIAPWSSVHREFRSPDRWQWDAESNALDGSVLPSRRPTPLLSARQGIVRERLRARIAGERLELLGDGGIAPIGEVILRDADGTWWLGTAPSLQKVTPVLAVSALARWQRAAGGFTTTSADGSATLSSVYNVVQQMLGGAELPPGTYVTAVAAAPWLDEHGLSVDYDASAHFVVGRLAPEDIVR